MKFRYDGQDYETTVDANTMYDEGYKFVQLPDRTYLEIERWLVESLPPKVSSFIDVDSDYSEINSESLVAQARRV